MRRLGRMGLGVALAIGLSAGAAYATDKDATDSGTDSNKGWFASWFGSSSKPPEKKPPAPPRQPAPKPAALARPTSMLDAAAAERAREVAIYYRRLEVIDRLMAVAVNTHDDQLLHQVEQLEERVQTAYTQRTAHLPVGAVGADFDKQILEKNLSTASAPVAPAGSATHLVQGASATGPRAAQEDER